MRVFICFIVLFFLLSENSIAQKKKYTIDESIDSILKTRPKTYKGVNDILRFYKRDTSKLHYIIEQFDKNNYLYGKTYALNVLGTRYRNFSNYKKAIVTHKEALKVAEEAKSVEFRVFSLNMLGVDYRRLDANRTALDYNQEALELAETVENPNLDLRRGIAIAHNSMGNIYLLLRQYELGIEQFKKSQKIEESINNKFGLAINNQNIGYAKEAMGELDEALKHYEESLAINLSSNPNNKLGGVICRSSIARIYIKQDKPKEALKLIKENLPVAIDLNNKKYLSTEYIHKGWAQTKIGEYTKAEVNLQKGLALAQKYNIPSTVVEAYQHLYELAEVQGDYKNSFKYYKLADEIDRELVSDRNIQYVNDLIIKYDSEKKNNQIEVLATQNEIAQLSLKRNKTILLISLISLVLLGTILYLLYRQRLNNNKNKILTLEQDLLNTQMNPHFIFNALNSIKLYIVNNEQKNAVHYLNKFSKLIRKILETSKIKETSLAEELETMDLYMSIENIRFSNEIVHETIVNPSINLDTIKVPPLVLQPFLENAIWHGLSSKKGDKKVTISVKQPDKDFVEISIEDNGIGRKESAKIKANKVINRKSIGINLTKERLENFVKDFHNNFSLTYKDLVDTNNNALGTKLTLQIPLS